MNAHDLIMHMIKHSGMSVRKLSTATGRKSAGAFSGILYGSRLPSPDTMSQIANACGWDLLARNRESGEEIIIDPPEK